ncbi:hypothetical protein NQ024_10560 [Corynebacterium sp. 35RC1]|nr:hypothetical protein [Corynebacterium sp. 35RC1]
MRFARLSSQMTALVAAAALATTTLSACSQEDPAVAELSVAPTTTDAPAFQAKEVGTITAPSLTERVKDEGLNVEYELQGAGYNNEGGGSVIYVLVHNLNEVPLPSDAITTSLSVSGTEVSPIDAGTIPLDLPLGPLASTNLQFAFDTSTGNLWDATFRIGNVEFNGNLNNV